MLIGIIFVIIFLSILILVHELGHFLVAKKFGLFVEEFGFGLPPKIWSKKIGETIYSINALPFGGFVKIFGEDGNNLEKLPESERKKNFASLKIWQRALIISAGVLFNFVLGWMVISLVFAIGTPQAVVITDIKKNSPAMEINLKAGDKIIGFVDTNKFIKYINENRGKEVSLNIERGKEKINFNVVPRINPPVGEGSLGVGLVDAGLPKKNPIASIWEGFKTSIELVKNIFLALVDLAVKAVIGKASFEQIAGPVGIIKLTSQAGSLGFIYLLQLLAMISLNLAVLNIFPFPALDGGRLIFLGIEKIKGSPINPKFEKIINTAGFIFLILLMAVITIKDIIKL
ncbi:MAG: RIP metalloprotease RseP [Patescibacteria group bacterium]